MFKQLMIGLLAIGAVAMWQNEAKAGCIPLANGTQYCSALIKGSGMPTAITTQQSQDPGNPVPPASGTLACEGFATSQGEGNDPFITLTLAGTVGSDCGLADLGHNQECDIKGVAVCGHSVKKNQTTFGPLFATSTNFGQTDGSTNSANLRFQIDTSEQGRLCGDDTFIAFFAREAFYEACLDDGINPLACVQQLCKTDDGGIEKDEVRVYDCKPIGKRDDHDHDHDHGH